MTRRQLTVLVLGILAWPARPRAQDEGPSCNECEHLCMWAPLLQSAMTTQQLYKDSDFVKSMGSVKELETEVNKIMTAWLSQQGQLTNSPCYKIIVKKFYLGERGARPDLDQIISSLPSSGNVFHTVTDDLKCPVVPNNPEAPTKMCGALLDAFAKHEAVHQQQCLWFAKNGKNPKGGKDPKNVASAKAFAKTTFFAASEVKAYEAQIKLMRQSMQELINRKGCLVSHYNIEDFAPKSGPADIQKARNLVQALQLVNDYNATKGGKK